MPDYPPKLLGIEETEFGSILILSDRREVPIDIGSTRLVEAFAEYGGRILGDLLAGHSLGVLAEVFETSEEEWTAVSHLVRADRAAEKVLRQHPIVWSGLHDSYDVVMGKPQRVYGSLGRALYTSHAFHFREDSNRSATWRRALLSAPGGWLFDARVDLQTGQVEIAAGVQRGHFVE